MIQFYIYTFVLSYICRLPRWLSGKEYICQGRKCNRFGFKLWVRKIPGNRKWQQPTPVFLPRKFHGQRILASYSQWGIKESDATDHIYIYIYTHTHTHIYTSQFVSIMVYHRILNIFSCAIEKALFFIHPIYNSLHQIQHF